MPRRQKNDQVNPPGSQSNPDEPHSPAGIPVAVLLQHHQGNQERYDSGEKQYPANFVDETPGEMAQISLFAVLMLAGQKHATKETSDDVK